MLIPLLLAATLSSNLRAVERAYQKDDAKRLVPLLVEVLHFPTVAGDDDARREQVAWLKRTSETLGLTFRDAGPVTEIELTAADQNAPILGLVVHGDVQPVDADAWSFPPFSGKVEGGFVYGRGAADDKGPLVQALLAMHALKASGIKRTHTVRLLVGSDEESGSTDIGTYLKTHAAPDYSLVLDSNFPVVVGEKAWNSLTVTTTMNDRILTTKKDAKPWLVSTLDAGLATSIVPDRAEAKLRWAEGTAAWETLEKALRAIKLPEGTRLVTKAEADELRVVAYGQSAHAGVNLSGGRNALVALAIVMEGQLNPGGAADLLAFARQAGRDLTGTALGITDYDPLWGTYAVNVATIKRDTDHADRSTLTINVRRIPPRTGPQLKALLERKVAEFNEQLGAMLIPGGFYADEPLAFDPKGKLVKRLLKDYAAATGEKNPKPAISGGGTYAKRLPNSIAFGMWFPDKPYPGHDVNERAPIADLERGERVLLRALVDLATGRRVVGAFGR